MQWYQSEGFHQAGRYHAYLIWQKRKLAAVGRAEFTQTVLLRPAYRPRFHVDTKHSDTKVHSHPGSFVPWLRRASCEIYSLVFIHCLLPAGALALSQLLGYGSSFFARSFVCTLPVPVPVNLCCTVFDERTWGGLTPPMWCYTQESFTAAGTPIEHAVAHCTTHDTWAHKIHNILCTRT